MLPCYLSAQFHSLLKAFSPQLRLSEGMKSGRFGVSAVWVPFFERPCELCPMPGARHSDVQTLDHAVFWKAVHLLTAWDLVHSLEVHAPCCKLVFAILMEVCMVAYVNWQPYLAILHVCQKLAESQTRENFQASMEAHAGVLAVLHVYTVFSDNLPPHNFAKPLRDEDSAGISFDDPGETLPVSVCFDSTPHIEEDRQVHIVLGVRPSNAFWISNLHKTARVGVELHHNITEHHPPLACKDGRLQQLRLLEELNVLAFLFPTSVADSH